MNDRTAKLLKQYQQDLERINRQRRLWLYASSVVIVAVVALIVGWDLLEDTHSKSVWWFVITCMLIISVNWWYWTMRVIRRLLEHQAAEFDLLQCILTDITIVREDIKFLAPKNVDNLK